MFERTPSLNEGTLRRGTEGTACGGALQFGTGGGLKSGRVNLNLSIIVIQVRD
jgi:hypothetical protein